MKRLLFGNMLRWLRDTKLFSDASVVDRHREGSTEHKG